MKFLLKSVSVFLILLFNQARAQTIAPFKNGERVVFLGNSITDGGHYHSYIWLYYMTHFPTLRIRCFNAGIGGDNVKQMSDRFEDEVLPMHPTVLTLTWGMNDTGYNEWLNPDAAKVALKNIALAEERYKVLEGKLQKIPAVKKIFLLGSPYDETTTSNPQRYYKGKAAAFASLIDFQKLSARNNGYGVVDFHYPMLAINKQEQMKDPAFSLAPNDRIHPDNDGHMVMAYLFLKAQGLDGQVVADVVINALNKTVIRCANAVANHVSAAGNGIGFDYLAHSLPYAADTIPRGWGNKKKQADGLALIPFNKEFNQELLTIKGLKAGNYQLLIDQQPICTYTSQQLAAGVNLAEQPYTPQYQQAIQIRELNEERWGIERRLRDYAFMQFDLLKAKGLLYADNRAAMDTVEQAAKTQIFVKSNKDNYLKAQYKAIREAWQKEMNVLIDQIYTINQPKQHHIELKPTL